MLRSLNRPTRPTFRIARIQSPGSPGETGSPPSKIATFGLQTSNAAPCDVSAFRDNRVPRLMFEAFLRHHGLAGRH